MHQQLRREHLQQQDEHFLRELLVNLVNFNDLGVSENSVPLHPMVLLIIVPMKNGYFIGNINPTFSDKPIC